MKRAKVKKSKTFIVTITIRSKTGIKPDVRTIGGDVVFCSMREGMTATWTLKRKKEKPKEKHWTGPDQGYWSLARDL